MFNVKKRNCNFKIRNSFFFLTLVIQTKTFKRSTYKASYFHVFICITLRLNKVMIFNWEQRYLKICTNKFNVKKKKKTFVISELEIDFFTLAIQIKHI